MWWFKKRSAFTKEAIEIILQQQSFIIDKLEKLEEKLQLLINPEVKDKPKDY